MRIECIVREADGIVSISASAYYRTRFIRLVVEESAQTYSQCTRQLYKRSERRNVNIFLDTCDLFYGKSCTVCQFFQTYFFCCSKAFYFFSNNVGSIRSIVFFTMKSRYVAFNESDLGKYSKVL